MVIHWINIGENQHNLKYNVCSNYYMVIEKQNVNVLLKTETFKKLKEIKVNEGKTFGFQIDQAILQRGVNKN